MAQQDDSGATFPERASIAPGEFSSDFLQMVVDALPEALVVMDRDRNIVMANRVAQVHQTCLKCYQCFHHRQESCVDVDCPAQMVAESGSQVRVYHTHYNTQGKEVSVAIDAAPIFDEQGEIVYTIETCRDVTERTLERRLSRIGNRHMKMAPLLAEYAKEIRGFTSCSQVMIHLLDEACVGCGGESGTVDQLQGSPGPPMAGSHGRICIRSLGQEIERELPPATENGSLRFDRFSAFLSQLPETLRNRFGSCVLPNCETVALVPIRYANEELALLHVADPRPNLISAAHVESLERLNSELGAAVHRVRVEEALKEVRDHLEIRVRERTQELTASNESLQQEIAERSRLERELLDAGVSEQQRIGQELHDGLGQELTGISYLAQNLVVKLNQQASPQADLAKELARGIRTVVGEIQKIVRGLVPLEIGAADLKPALQVMASNVEKQTGVPCRFDTNGKHVITKDSVAIQVYRIAQEAITNAVKHSQASEITVTLLGSDDEIRLEVCDDGIGIRSEAGGFPGCGLRSMRHRARAIEGKFDVRQRPGGGTIVECRVARSCKAESDSRK